MALKFIVSEEKDGNELPWLNDYLDEHPEKQDKFCSAIQEFVIVPKGILVITLDYKGFLFKDSKICKFLLQAFDYWKADPKNAQINGLFLSASSKPNIAIDEEVTGVTAIFDSKKKIELRWSNNTKKHTGNNLEENPFLPKAKK